VLLFQHQLRVCELLGAAEIELHSGAKLNVSARIFSLLQCWRDNQSAFTHARLPIILNTDWKIHATQALIHLPAAVFLWCEIICSSCCMRVEENFSSVRLMAIARSVNFFHCYGACCVQTEGVCKSTCSLLLLYKYIDGMWPQVDALWKLDNAEKIDKFCLWLNLPMYINIISSSRLIHGGKHF
jgi:hypothetical protein